MPEFMWILGSVAVIVGVIASLLGALTSWRMVLLARRAEADLLNKLTQAEINHLREVYIERADFKVAEAVFSQALCRLDKKERDRLWYRAAIQSQF